ncbi:MAG: amino acid adenylation domain-containing protein [Chitinophagaceae bacterium]
MYLGGVQLARGYWNRPELTAERFVLRNGVTMYKTGDQARWLPDGNIEYIGRADNQVKIRGYRVELGEIETVLQQAPGVKQGVVIAKEDKQGIKKLIAYIVIEGTTKDEIINHLKLKLPDYMVPGMMIELESLPLNNSGKIDRKRLPDPESLAGAKEKYKAARNETEAKLVAIWQKLLEVERIGIEDDFFASGGHSLLAIQLMSAVRKEFNKAIAIKDVFGYPTIARLSELINGKLNANTLSAITRSERTGRLPLSFAQERLWFIDRLQGSVQYHMPWVFRLTGELNVEALQQSFRMIVNRHEILRTVIKEENGVGYQLITDADQWKLQYIRQEDIDSLQDHIENYIHQPYDLSQDQLLRVKLIRVSDTEHLLVAVIHHIAFDGLSVSTMVQELAELYRSACEGRTALLKQLPVQYADYSIWQRAYLSGETLDKKLAYWKNKLDNVEPLGLLTDYKRPSEPSIKGASVTRLISKSIRDSFVQLSQQEGVTLFMSTLSVFKVLLYRYTAQADICVGTPVGGRHQQEIEDLIGLFVNTLAVRTQLGNDLSFRQVLQQVRQTTLDAYEHQELPFEKVVEALGVERDMSRTPVFQVMFSLINAGKSSALDLGNVQLTTETQEKQTADFDISFDVAESPEGMQLIANYCSDLYSEATMERMLMHYEHLLEAVIADADAAIGLLPILSNEEQHQLTQNAQEHINVVLPHNTIIDLLEQQVLQSPHATALVFGQQQLTYTELNERANQLAHYLRSKEVKEEAVVALCMPRSFEMIIAILGVLKAGGAYLPIDPEYPAERISYMLEDSQPVTVLTTFQHEYLFSSVSNESAVLCFDAIKDELADQPVEKLQLEITRNHLVYIIYTSGSTGKPKGVMTEHGALLNMVMSMTEMLNIGANERMLQFYNYCFDASIAEIFPALVNGAALILISERVRLDKNAFERLLVDEKITHLDVTPGFLSTLQPGKYAALKRVIAGGEQCTAALAIQWGAHVAFYNAYGPTEAGVTATIYRYSKEQQIYNDGLPIGRPLPNTSVYILDRNMNPVPEGVAGELYIGGAQVARGYLNRPELTAERFVTNPEPGRRALYKTGDLARWLPDGNVEYLGRIDEQVKIRGYRIELGEIESVLAQAPGIKQAVVLVKQEQNTKRLAAYVVSNGDLDRNAVNKYLSAHLPEYMVPSILFDVPEIPLTSNDKIDKKRLLSIETSLAVTDNYQAPSTESEKHLAAVWQDLLGVDRVGIEDNFFELGGDSIITIQVVSRMKRLGYELSPRDLFLHQTIAKLSAVISERETLDSKPQGEQGLLEGSSGLLPIQQVFFETEHDAASHYNQSVLLGIDKQIEPALLEKCIKKIVAQHDSIRFRYVHTADGWEQVYGSYESALDVEDLTAVKAESLADTIREKGDKYQRSLDIEQGLLIKVVLMLTLASEMHNRLLVVIHHLAIDGVSWRILLEDLEQLLSDENAVLPAKTNSYREWYNALLNYSNSKKLIAQQNYWRKTVQAYNPLKLDNEYQGISRMSDMDIHSVTLPAERTLELLQQVPQVYHTEINDILLACLGRTLATWNDSDKIVIGLEGHGREDMGGSDLTRTTGWFTSLYPVLLEVPQDNSNASLLKSVKEQMRKMPDKGMGYGILKYMKKDASLQGEQPWDILFNYLGQADNVVNKSRWFTGAEESTGRTLHEDAVWTNKLEINSIVSGGELIIKWSYNNKYYRQDTIEQLAAQYVAGLESMIAHCIEQFKTGPVSTPSDYGLQEVGYEELDNFLEENINGRQRKDLIESMYRLSGLQEGILFHGLYDKQAGAYMQQVKCEIVDLDIDAFRKSWNTLLQRHTILRTGFHHNDLPVPVQCVYRSVSMPVEVLDYRAFSAGEQLLKIKDYQAADLRKGFDFKQAPLMRATLIQLSDNRYKMLWTTHHLPLDGWSVPMLVQEFLQTYDAQVSSSATIVVEEDRYEDYIRYIESTDKDKEEEYWRTYLGAIEGGTLLPFVSTANERTLGVSEYREEPWLLGEELSARVEAYAHQQRITVNTLMQGVWSYLLHRYTGNAHVAYGIMVSGRPENLSNIEQRVGMFINAIPLHSVMDENKTVAEWLQALQAQQSLSLEYQYTPLGKIQTWVDTPGELFDSMMTFQNFPVSKIVSSHEWKLKVENLEVYEPTSNYPFSIRILLGKEMYIQFIYREEVLQAAYAKQIRHHFENVLLQLIENASGKLNDIHVLSPAEEWQVTEEFNATDKDYSIDKTIPDLFEEQVELYANEIALVFQDEQFTFRELDELSNQFAYYLQSKGVKEETLVPVCLDRSADMIVAILGILKAGGAYVPLDPALPAERIGYMLNDTGATIIVTASDHEELIATQSPGGELICIDTLRELLPLLPSEKPARSTTASNLAYIIYTSGSTGLPKGVMIEHRGVINLTYNQVAPLNLRPGIRVFQFASFSFDASCHEVFTTLLNGGRFVVAPKETLLDTKLLAELLNRHEIELVTLPPSYQSAIGDEIGGLKTVISAGEMLNTKLAADIQQKGIKLINAYGPTENTVSSILSTDPLHASGCVTIGKPLDNVKAYILDSRMQPVPVGVTGELYLGGVQLARGYWNRPELTAERFVVRPSTSLRMYKTGDQARWLPDGNIEYIGRADDQVKIRGYRVELGEIETILQQSPGVRQGVVIAKEDKQGTKKLIAYIVIEETNREEVTNYLKSKLPEYMVPGVIIELESLPLNNSGKVDRKRLPDAESLTTTTEKYKAARNETEAKLVAIWQELLELERIGIEDDFFESGGHSLLAIQLISAIRKEFGKEIAIKDVFDYPTIAMLAEQVNAQQEDVNGLPAITQSERTDRLPLSFSQERLWFIDRLQGSVQYHMPWVFRLTGDLDVDALQQSFRTIVSRHEILRTVIKEEDGIGYQYITDADQWQLQYVDETDIIAESNTRQAFIEEFLEHPYDLSKDAMLRVALIRISPDEHMLVALLHHIAFDGWSISILVEELVELYRSHCEAREAILKPLPVQYVDYAIWQHTHLSGETLETKLDWWKQKLRDVEPLALLTDNTRPPGQTINGGVIHKRMSKQLRDELALLSQQEGTTMFMTLLSVFKVLLHRYTGQSDICVGSPVAGRHRQEIEGLIGLFVNTLALRSEVNGKMTYQELLQQIRQSTIEAYEHQDVPFEKVVEALGVERDLSRSPVFQVMFVLQNLPKNTALDLGNVSLSGEEAGSITSKFDLNLSISESTDGLYVSLTYCSDLFVQETIERMLMHYENLLQAVLSNKNTSLEQLPMLAEQEVKQLQEFSTSTVAYPKDKTIVELFEEQVLNIPDALAVVFEEEELTYYELNERADQLAAWLMYKGVKKDEFVVISVKRSLECIVGILGILKAGAAFVPIDPTYPDERIAYMLSDTSCRICLADASIKERSSAISNDVQFVNIKEEWEMITAAPAAKPVLPAVNNLAYVIYTSGSTGKPKGVLIAHQALVDHVFGVIESAELEGCVSFALFASLVADAGHSMLFSALVCGSAVHVLSDEVLTDGEKVVNYLRDNSIDAIKLVPSLWMAYADNDHIPLPRRMLMFGGESFQMNILELLSNAGYAGNVFNHYGPTEATIGKCIHKIDLERKYVNVPIGSPFSNTSTYIFNPAFELCPVGVPGELFIGGDGLANGYLNLPELTNEKFIVLSNGERLYKTGDVVRWSPEGDIEYLGRTDDQVKIRGHRIELGEIATALQLAPGVKQGLVVTKTDKLGTKRLVGYVVPEEGFDKDSTMVYLRSKLPDYMVPAILMELDAIPLTTIGKIDRRRLPEPEFVTTSSGTYEAPRNEVEIQLASVWRDLLGAERIGIHDNFFELGGDSIITIQVVSRVKRLQYELYPRDLFLHQTIAKLASLVMERQGSASQRVGEQGVLTGTSGLLPIQQGYLESEPVHISHYNQGVLLSIDKNINEEILEKALQSLLSHHDSLRFTYTQTTEGWQQVYGNYEGKLDVEDLRALSVQDLPAAVEKASEQYQRSLDITNGLLIRVALLLTPESETHNRVLVVIHHLAIDGVSWRILLEDLELLLTSLYDNEQPDLGSKTSSYREWYNGLVKYGETKKLLSQKNYWQKVVQAYQPLKTDKLYEGNCLMSEISNHATKLNAERTKKLLQEVPQAYHTEINDILLACLSKTLVDWNGGNGLVVGMEGHGREDILEGLDISRTVGWFTNIYPVLLEVQPATEEGSLLKSVKEQLRRIPDKGLGYGVLKFVHRTESLQGAQPWDVVFNYLGQADNVVSKSKWLAGAGEPSGNPLSEAVVRHHKLEVNSVVSGGELNINWNYSSKHFEAATVQLLADKYINNLEAIIDHCLETIKNGGVYTPSDYGLTTEISYEELDKFMDAEESSDMDSIMNF